MKKYQSYTIILLFILWVVDSSFVNHPINICITDIRTSGKNVTITFKIFTDDLEGALRANYPNTADLINVGIDRKTEANIQHMVGSNFQLFINGTLQKLKYKSSSVLEDVVKIEYHTDLASIQSIKNMKFKNTLLFKDFPEQKNIINVHVSDNLKVLQFENNEEGKGFKEISF